MHVAVVAVFDGGDLVTPSNGVDVERVRAHLLDVLDRVPRYRQRLAHTPLSGHPVWVDDPDFSISYHLRHTSLPRPGDARQLKRLAGQIMSQKLDRTKPLWETWLVEGLEGGRFALIIKAHHCMVDGGAGVDLLAALFGSEAGEAPSAWRARPLPGPSRLVADELLRRARIPGELARSLARAASHPREAGSELLASARGLLDLTGGAFAPASRTPLNPEAIGPHRHFDWVRLDLAAVLAVKERLGGKLNDVVLATLSGAVRRYLQRHGLQPDELDFRVIVPVSTRRSDERGRPGNRVASLVVELPVGDHDPVSRHRQVSAKTRALKESRGQVRGVEWVERLADWTRADLITRLSRFALWRRVANMGLRSSDRRPAGRSARTSSRRAAASSAGRGRAAWACSVSRPRRVFTIGIGCATTTPFARRATGPSTRLSAGSLGLVSKCLISFAKRWAERSWIGRTRPRFATRTDNSMLCQSGPWGLGPRSGQRPRSHGMLRPMTRQARFELDGQALDLPVRVGSEGEVGVDISQLRARTGAITLDPSFANTGACESAITYIDGEQGILRYRGYDISDLAEHATFPEVCHLLIYGELPTQDQREEFRNRLTRHSLVHEDMKKFFEGFPPSAHPMAILSAMIASLSAYYPESDTPEEIDINIIRLLAKAKTLAAFSYKKSIGQPFIYPDNSLTYLENFLYMMFAVPSEPYVVEEALRSALNKILILHADHEQNCSTTTVRTVGSGEANLFASISAGVCALWGPLHGGANQAVIEMLEMIRADGSNYKKYVDLTKAKDSDFKLMGFGHRVYKNFDPRALILKQSADEVLGQLGIDDPLLEIAKQLEEVALADEYFIERKLYPNVDFYSGVLYRAMGIPTDMFTVMFALGRLPGWIAHWLEQRNGPGVRITRPRQIYTGPVSRPWVPLGER